MKAITGRTPGVVHACVRSEQLNQWVPFRSTCGMWVEWWDPAHKDLDVSDDLRAVTCRNCLRGAL